MIFYRFLTSLNLIISSHFQVFDDEDVVTMITIHCKPKNYVFELYVELNNEEEMNVVAEYPSSFSQPMNIFINPVSQQNELQELYIEVSLDSQGRQSSVFWLDFDLIVMTIYIQGHLKSCS